VQEEGIAEAYWKHIPEKLSGSANLYSDIWGSSSKVKKSSPDIRKVRLTPCSSLIPVHFAEKSEIRPEGYKMWDFIMASHAQGTKLKKNPTSFRELTPDKGVVTNSYWFEDTWQKFVYQDEGDFHNQNAGCLDLRRMDDAYKYIDLASQVAYSIGDRAYRKANYWEDYNSNSYYFAKAFAEIIVAMLTGLPVDFSKKEPLPYGIVVRPSLRMGFTEETAPILQEPITTHMSIDENLIFICVAIEAGTDPAAVLSSYGKKTEDCAWAYLPQKVAIAGWETAAWVSLSTVTSIDRIGWTDMKAKAALSTHCKDLIQYPTLKRAISSLIESEGRPPDSYKYLTHWLENGYYPAREVLPCPSCFLSVRDHESPFQHPTYATKFKLRPGTPLMGELNEYKKTLNKGFTSIRAARRMFLEDYPSKEVARSYKSLRDQVVREVRAKHHAKRRRR
jgi:hypothetical protein